MDRQKTTFKGRFLTFAHYQAILKSMLKTLITFTILVSSTAYSATRSIPFIGMTDSKNMSVFIAGGSVTSGICKLAIYNSSSPAGGSNQIIEAVDVAQMNGAGTSLITATGGVPGSLFKPLTEFAAAGLTVNAMHLNDVAYVPPAPGVITACVGATASLKPGAMCIYQYQFFMIPFNSDVTVCAGRVRVRDADPAIPGSVVATGSMMVTQESRVLGGVLSSAFYQTSPSIIGGATVTAAGSTTQAQRPADLWGGLATAMGSVNSASGSMNPYCTILCRNANSFVVNSQSWLRYNEGCYNLCGGDPIQSIDDAHPPWAGIGAGFVRQSRTSLDTHTDTTDPNTLQPVYVRTSGAGGMVSAETLDATGDMTYREAKAYYQWGGGMINEMTIGSFDTICNGNEAYQGVRDHSHVHHGVGNNTEYLYCAHRHGNSDLFSGNEQTYPFMINGGMPF